MRLNDTNIDKFYGCSQRPVRWDKTKNYLGYGGKKNMSVQKDCFAYRIGHCSIMTEMICRRENCSFYKTKEQDRQDRETYGYRRDYGKSREDA